PECRMIVFIALDLSVDDLQTVFLRMVDHLANQRVSARGQKAGKRVFLAGRATEKRSQRKYNEPNSNKRSNRFRFHLLHYLRKGPPNLIIDGLRGNIRSRIVDFLARGKRNLDTDRK